MTLNTLGPMALIALAVPLLGIWNVPPLAVVLNSSFLEEPERRATSPQAAQPPPRGCYGACSGGGVLGASQYFGALLLGSALSMAWLWRHLMVWRVIAPQYMFGVLKATSS